MLHCASYICCTLLHLTFEVSGFRVSGSAVWTGMHHLKTILDIVNIFRQIHEILIEVFHSPVFSFQFKKPNPESWSLLQTGGSCSSSSCGRLSYAVWGLAPRCRPDVNLVWRRLQGNTAYSTKITYMYRVPKKGYLAE